MEAPDKIYLYREKPKDYFDEDWYESSASDVENVAYIRKDLLLGWAKELTSEPYNRTTESARKIQIAHYLLEKYDSL
jgi:hypothetical protein